MVAGGRNCGDGPQEADVDLALLELLKLLPGRHMHQLQRGVAVRLAELMHGARKDVVHRHGSRESHPNLPGIARCHLLHHLARLIQRGQRGAGLVQEQGAGGRQRHVMAGAFEQRAAQFLFQCLDLDAEWRLATCSLRAASLKLKASATATKYRSWRKSMIRNRNNKPSENILDSITRAAQNGRTFKENLEKTMRGSARRRVSQGARRPFLATSLATLLAAALGLTVSAPQAAEAYPDKPIRLVVPYAAGGAVDIVARAVGQKMGQVLKQPIIVDNRPGRQHQYRGWISSPCRRRTATRS